MKLYYIKVSLSLAIASFAVAGCLKDQAYEDLEIQSTRPEGTPRIIEIKVTATSVKNFLSLAYDNSNKDTLVDLVPIQLATSGVASEDINVTVGLKTSLVDDYNTVNQTAYDVPAASMYTMENNGVVTIPKGSRTAFLRVKFVPASFIGHDWALGLAINSIDKNGYTISGNFGTAVVSIATKNQYDGLYHSVGYFEHPSAPRDFDLEEMAVKTFNANTITKALGDLGDGTPINITINPDNTVTIGPGPGATGTTAQVANFNDPTRPEYNNKYDPATKTFMLSYGYPMPSPTRTVTERLVYTGPR